MPLRLAQPQGVDPKGWLSGGGPASTVCWKKGEFCAMCVSPLLLSTSSPCLLLLLISLCTSLSLYLTLFGLWFAEELGLLPFNVPWKKLSWSPWTNSPTTLCCTPEQDTNAEANNATHHAEGQVLSPFRPVQARFSGAGCSVRSCLPLREWVHMAEGVPRPVVPMSWWPLWPAGARV